LQVDVAELFFLLVDVHFHSFRLLELLTCIPVS
jgi:hypothetical protein